MRFEKVETDYHIYLEKEETEEQVLRALVRASFELSRPAGAGWMRFDEGQEMTEEAIDVILRGPSMGSGDAVVYMDYIQGRQCKTSVRKIDEGHFVLNGYLYERDRGTPDTLFDRINEIISGVVGLGDVAIKHKHMYRGESLTLRLKEYGYDRNPGESDWEFRKRIFPALFRRGSDRAMEFLMGASAAEWEMMERLICLAVLRKKDITDQELAEFAEAIGPDPLDLREHKRVAPFN